MKSKNTLVYGEWVFLHHAEDHPFFINLCDDNGALRPLRAPPSGTIRKMTLMPIYGEPALLIAGTSTGSIEIWKADGEDFPHFRTLEGHQDEVLDLAVSKSSANLRVPDGRCLLASCSHDRTVKLWNVITGECLKTFTSKNTLNSLISNSFAK